MIPKNVRRLNSLNLGTLEQVALEGQLASSGSHLVISDTANLQVGIRDASNTYERVVLSTQAGGAGKPGLIIGSGSEASDVVLYREEENKLRTPDSLIVGTSLGIGTVDPDSNLDVFDSSNPTIKLSTSAFSNSENGSIIFQGADIDRARITHDEDANGIRFDGSADNNLATSSFPIMFLNRVNGKVGIGATPSSVLHVVDSQNVNTWTSLSDCITDASFRFLGSNHANAYGLYMGYANASNDAQGIQSSSSTLAKPLVLNPFGGNVGIGTTTPSSKLEISTTPNVTYLEMTPTSTGSTDNYGEIKFWGDANKLTGRYSAIRGENSGGVNVNELVFITGNAGTVGERMRIDSVGRVGIGTSDPAELLHTSGTTGARIFHSGNTLNDEIGVTFGTTPGTRTKAGIYGINLNTGNAAGGIVFKTNNGSTLNEVARFTDDGKFGLGTGSPSSFSVDGDDFVIYTTSNTGLSIISGSASKSSLFFGDGVSTGVASRQGQLVYDHSTDAMSIHTNASQRVVIDSSGNVGIGTSSPGTGLGGKVLHLANSGATASIKIERTDASTAGWIGLSSGNTENSIYSTGTKPVSFYTNSNKVVTLDSSGNVGIGTSSPESALHIKNSGASSTSFVLENTGTNGRKWLIVSGEYGIGNTPFTIYDGTAEATRMAINSSGNVGIGTVSPENKLHVDLGASGDIAKFEGSGTNFLTIGENSGVMEFDSNNGSASIAFKTNNTERIRINSSGNLGIGTTNPTSKLEVSTAANVTYLEMTPTSAGSNDNYGEIKFWGSSVKTAGRYSSIMGINNGGVNVNEIGIITGYADSVSEKVRISGQGKVGIGTTGPDDKLHLAGVDQTYIRIESTDTTSTAAQILGGIVFEGNDASTFSNGIRAGIYARYEGTSGGTALVLSTAADGSPANIERFRITNNGNFSFGGDSSPSYNIQLKKSGNASVGIISEDGYSSSITLRNESDDQSVKLNLSDLGVVSLHNENSDGMSIYSGFVQIDGNLHTGQILLNDFKNLATTYHGGAINIIDTITFTTDVTSYSSIFIDPFLSGDAPTRTLTNYSYFRINAFSGISDITITNGHLFSFEQSLSSQQCLTNSDKTGNAKSGTIKIDVNGTLYHLQLYADS